MWEHEPSESEVLAPAEVRVLGTADQWFVWLLALGALAVPVIVLVCADSIPKDTLAWHEVYVSVERGDFLVPVMILCAETVRRWWREVRVGPVLKCVRIIATFLCTVAALVCVVATTTAASVAVTAQSGRSIGVITASCLIVALVFGTLAVGVSAGKVGG
jgi:hypothetical protein